MAAHAGAMTAGESVQESAAAINPWLIAFTVMLATFMEVLDTSVANVSLPHIAGSLAATVDEGTWVLTSYLVSNAIVLPLSGWFSTLFGRKRFYMACVILFTLSSALCGLAPSLEMLILFRILQGLGGGALQPISQAILVESFPRSKTGMAMAVYGMGVVLAPVIGPTLGGWITDNYSWRWIFLINIPVGILSLTLTSFLIKDPHYLVRRTFRDGLKIDYIGLSLLVVGLGCLEIMLDEGQKEDWFSSGWITAAAVIASCALISVLFWELRQKAPVIDFRLLKDRNFFFATFALFILGFVLYGSTMLLPLFLQLLLGYTAMLSGLVLSPGGLVIICMMPLVGTLLSKTQPRWLIIFGLTMTSAGLFQMAGFNLDIDYRAAIFARCIQSVGLAFLFVPINTAAFAFIPKERIGAATGIINLARNIGGSTGIAMTTTFLWRRAQFHQQMLVSHLTPLDPSYQQALHAAGDAMQGSGAGAAQGAQQAYGLIYGMVVKQANLLAFVDMFWLLAVFILMVIPVMFFLKRVRPHHEPVAME